MKELSRQRTYLLISIGMFVIAIAPVIFRYLAETETYDWAFGLMEGIGMGLIIFALLKGKLKRSDAR